MKKLILILLAVACLTAPALAEEGQVVLIKGYCTETVSYASPRYVYTLTIKNIGAKDAKNVQFWFVTPNGKDIALGDTILYLPSKETIEARIYHGYHVKDFPYGCELAVDMSYDIVQ